MKNKKSNTSGFVTADFIFSFLLASMMTTLLFAMCFAFTVIEIAQYISFSATRAAIPAQKTYAEQRARVDAKYQQLISNPVIAPLLTNGWFTLAIRDVRLNETPSDDFREEYSGETASLILPAAGVRLTLTANILNLNLGPLGRIESETGNGFNLTLGTLLLREPTQQECQRLIQSRYERILNLESRYRTLGSVGLTGANPYFPMEDNGC